MLNSILEDPINQLCIDCFNFDYQSEAFKTFFEKVLILNQLLLDDESNRIHKKPNSNNDLSNLKEKEIEKYISNYLIRHFCFLSQLQLNISYIQQILAQLNYLNDLFDEIFKGCSFLQFDNQNEEEFSLDTINIPTDDFHDLFIKNLVSIKELSQKILNNHKKTPKNFNNYILVRCVEKDIFFMKK